MTRAHVIRGTMRGMIVGPAVAIGVAAAGCSPSEPTGPAPEPAAATSLTAEDLAAITGPARQADPLAAPTAPAAPWRPPIDAEAQPIGALAAPP